MKEDKAMNEIKIVKYDIKYCMNNNESFNTVKHRITNKINNLNELSIDDVKNMRELAESEIKKKTEEINKMTEQINEATPKMIDSNLLTLIKKINDCKDPEWLQEEYKKTEMIALRLKKAISAIDPDYQATRHLIDITSDIIIEANSRVHPEEKLYVASSSKKRSNSFDEEPADKENRTPKRQANAPSSWFDGLRRSLFYGDKEA
jgi:hypothetical protein